MPDTVRMLLKNSPLFGQLPDEIIGNLGAAINERKLQDGEILFREGDQANTCFIIKLGTVEILKKDMASGRNFRLATRGKGEFLGEMSLIEDSPRFATARANGGCVVLEITRERFAELIGQHPSIAIKVMEALSSRLRQADLQMISDLQRKNEQLELTNRRLHETTIELEKSYTNLKIANRFLEKIISAAAFFIIVADRDGKIFIFNDAAKRIFGCNFQDVAGSGIRELINPVGKDDVCAEIEKSLKQGTTWQGDLLTETINKNKLFIELVAARVFDEKGGDFASLYMGRDITDEKNMERQMILLERMATRGEMAAEIAHELNNYLSIVLGNLELLQMDLDMGKVDSAPKKMSSMKEGLDKITRFTDGLMMYSRPVAKKEEFDLNVFLENELFFIRPQNRFDGVDFICEFDHNAPHVTADKSQMQQAILNLLNNAADALAGNSPNNKKITLRTHFNQETAMVKISVIDNGVGLSDESLARVFRQHFTSKESGHGFGLLAVKRVIKNHAGKVWAERNPSGGATFSIEFPLSPEDTLKAYAKSPS